MADVKGIARSINTPLITSYARLKLFWKDARDNRVSDRRKKAGYAFYQSFRIYPGAADNLICNIEEVQDTTLQTRTMDVRTIARSKLTTMESLFKDYVLLVREVGVDIEKDTGRNPAQHPSKSYENHIKIPTAGLNRAMSSLIWRMETLQHGNIL